MLIGFLCIDSLMGRIRVVRLRSHRRRSWPARHSCGLFPLL